MVLEFVLLLITLPLVLWVLLPALIDALQYLFVAAVYMSVVIAAFGITAFVLLALCFQPDENTIEEQLNGEAILYLESSCWVWARFV